MEECRVMEIFSFPTKNEGRFERKATIMIGQEKKSVILSVKEKYARILQGIRAQEKYRLIEDRGIVQVHTEDGKKLYLIQ